MTEEIFLFCFVLFFQRSSLLSIPRMLFCFLAFRFTGIKITLVFGLEVICTWYHSIQHYFSLIHLLRSWKLCLNKVTFNSCLSTWEWGRPPYLSPHSSPGWGWLTQQAKHHPLLSHPSWCSRLLDLPPLATLSLWQFYI